MASYNVQGVSDYNVQRLIALKKQMIKQLQEEIAILERQKLRRMNVNGKQKER